MRKSLKKLAGAVLVTVLCVMMVPAQTVKAEENVKEVIADAGEMSEEQLMNTYMGTWKIYYPGETIYNPELVLFEKGFSEEVYGTTEWNYVDIVESKGNESESSFLALHFTNEENEYNSYCDREWYGPEEEMWMLNIACCGKVIAILYGKC